MVALYTPQRPIDFLGLHTDTFFVMISLGLGVWGLAQGTGSSPMEALLADSVPTGGRLCRSELVVMFAVCSAQEQVLKD